MSTIITFHSLNGDFLQTLLANLEGKFPSSYHFLRNYCTDEAKSDKSGYNFIERLDFLDKIDNRAMISGNDVYSKIKYGLDIVELEKVIAENSKKNILLNVSTQCKLNLQKKFKNIDFVSVLIELKDDESCESDENTNIEKKKIVMKNNKEICEYNIILNSGGKSQNELLSDEFYKEVFNMINKKIQENIILRYSKVNIQM